MCSVMDEWIDLSGTTLSLSVLDIADSETISQSHDDCISSVYICYVMIMKQVIDSLIFVFLCVAR